VKDSEELKNNGFTESGLARYEQTVEEYADLLYTKSINFGDADKAADYDREVTHDHVRAAAFKIAQSYGKEKVSGWLIFSQICEYIFTAIGAYSLSNLDETWGTPLFVGSAVIAGILVAIRLSRKN
jgi:hypothetical protein